MKSDMMFDRLEKMRGVELSSEEKHEINLWNKGRALNQIIVTEGWQVVLEILASYAGDATEKLVSTDPAETKEVLANHAIAFAAGRIYSNFVGDVNSAVEASRITPDCVKQGLRAGPAPVESSL